MAVPQSPFDCGGTQQPVGTEHAAGAQQAAGTQQIIDTQQFAGTQQPVGTQHTALEVASEIADCMIPAPVRWNSSRLNVSRFRTNRRNKPKKDADFYRLVDRPSGIAPDWMRIMLRKSVKIG
jgi:hypothetical protein